MSEEAAVNCHYCDRLAEFLCDAPLMFGPAPGGRARVVAEDADGAPSTCSRPLCRSHRVSKGSGFLCQRSGKGKGCHSFTIDYCPQCDVAERLR